MTKHLCRLFGHRRSKRKARPFDYTWRSECNLCGEHLERVGPKTWRALSEDQRHAA